MLLTLYNANYVLNIKYFSYIKQLQLYKSKEIFEKKQKLGVFMKTLPYGNSVPQWKMAKKVVFSNKL